MQVRSELRMYHFLHLFTQALAETVGPVLRYSVFVTMNFD